MIDLYTWTTPNGRKASIMLEEVGLPYTAHSVNFGRQEQFAPEFAKISPNNKIPAIVDNDASGGPLSIFESGAILIYLAEKTGKLLASSGAERYKALEWLNWQMGGIGPSSPSSASSPSARRRNRRWRSRASPRNPAAS